MHKVGDKFIIEIGEEYESEFLKTNIEADKEQKKSPVNLYRIKGFNSLVFDENGLDKLEKYDKNARYEKNLNDAWECMKKILDMTTSEQREVFNILEFSADDILEKLSPQEAVEKLKAWEEKHEIKVGDVVEVGEIGTFVITCIENENLYDCLKLGTLSGYTITDKTVLKKTGKHIDLTEIFKGLEEKDADSD